MFLFGYGSLIAAESRARTVPNLSALSLAVCVSGLRRVWGKSATRMTAVAVVAGHSDDSVNGVLVEVSDADILAFDEREQGYTRHPVPVESVRAFFDKVWTYKVHKPGEPSAAKPLAQSYIDVILAGALEYGEEFAVDFIRKTHSWPTSASHWVLDRPPDAVPLYVRPLHSAPDTLLRTVDMLLEKAGVVRPRVA